MTRLKPLNSKETWKIMNTNHYTHIFIGGLIMILLGLFMPGIYQSSDGSTTGLYLYFGIFGALILVSGLGGWVSSSKTVTQMEKNKAMKEFNKRQQW